MGTWAWATMAFTVMVAMAILPRTTEGTTHYRLLIKNMLGPEEQNNVDCKFYKTALGVYSIREQEKVEWELPIWDDRPFECIFNWQNKYADGVLFTLTQQGPFCSPEFKCLWELRPDGVFFLRNSDPGAAQRVLQWKE